MKELDELMEALRKRKIPQKLKMTVAVMAPVIKEAKPEETQKAINECIAVTLYKTFDEDEELSDFFMHFAIEVGMEALLKELNITAEEKVEIPEPLKGILDFLKNL